MDPRARAPRCLARHRLTQLLCPLRVVAHHYGRPPAALITGGTPRQYLYGWLPSPVYIHDNCSSGVVRTQTPDAPLGLRSRLGVLSSCGPTLPHLGGRDASRGSKGSKWLLRGGFGTGDLVIFPRWRFLRGDVVIKFLTTTEGTLIEG